MAYYFSPIGNGVAFVDSSGNPLSGAQLFTYTAGSSTKATVYQTNAGTAHTNPILLDANGRPPAAIWVTGGVSYKFVLAPSNDTDPPAAAIYTWDNVSGINDTSVAIDEWVAGPTPTFVDANTFTLVGDQSSTFHVNRRIKATVTAGTVYGYISAVAYTTLTTVDVVLDSGALDSGLSAVSYALLSGTNQSYPGNIATTDTTQTISGNKTLSGTNTLSGVNTFTNTTTRYKASSGQTNVYIDADGSSNGSLLFADNGTNEWQLTRQNSDNTFLIGESGVSDFIKLTPGGGIQIGNSPTGGDKGAGTINVASGLYISNVALGTLAWANFTPTVTLVGGAGNTVPVYSTNSGRYIRIGNAVHVSVYLSGDGGAEGAGTGQINIALPVAASASQIGSHFPCGVSTNGATINLLIAEVAASATTFALAYFDTISSTTILTGAGQNNTTRSIRASFSYEV